MGLVLLMHLKKIISEGSETESKRRKKTNKIWVVQGSEFYNNSFKDLKKKKNFEMYSTYNEGKSVVAKRFIRILKTRFLNIWQLMFTLMC